MTSIARSIIFFIALIPFVFGCATKKDLVRIEEKIDTILHATRRATLEDIFGPQTDSIRRRLDDLSAEERQRYENLLTEYQQGRGDIAHVREQLVQLLGGGTRVVSTPSGLYVRDLQGDRHDRAVPRGTRIEKCERVPDVDLPYLIRDSAVLSRFDWGKGVLDGEQVLFAWDYTLSEFTKEIVEGTATRTAEEFIRMGGNRPVQIQIVTEHPDAVKVFAPESHEVELRDERDGF